MRFWNYCPRKSLFDMILETSDKIHEHFINITSNEYKGVEVMSVSVGWFPLYSFELQENLIQRRRLEIGLL